MDAKQVRKLERKLAKARAALAEQRASVAPTEVGQSFLASIGGGVAAKPRATRERVGCAYAGCDKVFLPHSTGPLLHAACSSADAQAAFRAFVAATKANKDGDPKPLADLTSAARKALGF